MGRWILTFPATLTLGVVLIPVVPDYADRLAQEAAVAQEPRWLLGHLLAAMAFGVGVWVAAELCREVEARAPSRAWRVALAAVVTGAALHAAGLGADAIGPLAAVRAGASAASFFDGSQGLVPPVFIAGSVLFSLGQIGLVLGARRAGFAGGAGGPISLGAAILFGAAEAIPSGWGLYAVAALSWLIYWPLAAPAAPPK